MKIQEKSKEPSPPVSTSASNGIERTTVNKARKNGYSLRSRPGKSHKPKSRSVDSTTQVHPSRSTQGCSSSTRSSSHRNSHAHTHSHPIPSTTTAELKSTLDAQCEDIASGNKETDSAIHFLVSLLDLLEKEENKSADTSNDSLECESPSEIGIKQETHDEIDPNVIVHSFNGCDDEEGMSSTQDIEERFSSINIVESQSRESTKNNKMGSKSNISVKNENEFVMMNGYGNGEGILRSDVQMNGDKPIETDRKIGILEQRLLGLPLDQLNNSTRPTTHTPVHDMGMMLKKQRKATKQFFFECIKKDDPEYGNKLEQLEALKESNIKLEALVQARAQKLSSLRTFHAGLQTEAFLHHTG